MYKEYINSLLHVLTDHCYSICINSSKLASPSFTDDISLIALHSSFLTTFMNICHEYGLTWRNEFNHSKTGIVTFGETKAVHRASMNELEWRLGGDIVEELYEYKNLGVLKNYIESFSSNVADNIEKTIKKAGMIFSSSFDRRKTNALIFVTFWRQVWGWGQGGIFYVYLALPGRFPPLPDLFYLYRPCFYLCQSCFYPY